MNRLQLALVSVLFVGAIPARSLAGTYAAVVRWAPSAGPVAAGYRLYIRDAAASYVAGQDLGYLSPDADGALSTVAEGLDVHTSYVVAVSAYSSTGAEGRRSNEIAIGYVHVAPVVDSDGDGLRDAEEDTNLNGRVDPGERDPERSDTDSDGRGDQVDACPATPPGDTVSAVGCSCSEIACDDGNACDGPEGCVGGVCTASLPLDCDDGDVCTTDSCDTVAGCRHTDSGFCEPMTLSFAPVADTYVEAGREATWDHGASQHLDVDDEPRGVTYLKWDLHGVPNPVKSATLRVFCTNDSTDGGWVYHVPDSSWFEGHEDGQPADSGLRWGDIDTNGDGSIDRDDDSPYVPLWVEPLASLGGVNDGEFVEVDLTAAFQTGPGLYTLAIANQSGNGATYSSREDDRVERRPALVLEVGGAPPSLDRAAAIVDADASIFESNPDGNFGGSSVLVADRSTLKRTFLRVRVTGVDGRRIQSAALQLRVGEATEAKSGSGGYIRSTSSCAWDEDTLTFANQPSIDGPVLDAAGPVGSGDVVTFDLTEAIGGDGLYCFVIESDSIDGVRYASREAAPRGPEIVLQLAE